MKRWRADPKHSKLELVNPKGFVFRCQIPIYDPTGHGEVRYRIYNCKLGKYEHLSPKQLEKRKNEWK
jgi:hypothetical protein